MPTVQCPECDGPHDAASVVPGKPKTCDRCGHTWTPAAAKPPAPPKSSPRLPAAKPPAPVRPVPPVPVKPAALWPAPAPAAPPPLPLPAEPLPLDFDDAPPAATTPGGRPTLVYAALTVGLVVLAAGGAGVYFATRPQPAAVAKEAAGDPDTTPTTRDLRPEEVYPLVLRSAALVVTDTGHGSGVLVHRDRRLVLTNYHVVRGLDRVAVLFPAYDRAGELITRPAHYAALAREPSAVGKVVARNPNIDLALVELPSLPGGAAAVALAAAPAKPGETVYSVGGSGVGDQAGALWRLSAGQVRSRHRGVLSFRGGQQVDAMLLETQKPVNPGDSGGPTVNGRGELVAVVSSGDPRADLVKQDIDLSEVRAYLSAYAKADGWTWADGPPAPPPPAPSPAAPPPPPETVDTLRAALKTGPVSDRLAAARKLGAMKAAARPAVPDLLDALPGLNKDGQDAVLVALSAIGPPADADAGRLPTALASTDPALRTYALRVYAADATAGADALPNLAPAFAATDPDTRRLAVRAAGRAGPAGKPYTLSPLLDLLADPDPGVAGAAASALAAAGPFGPADADRFAGKLSHPSVVVRRYCVGQLEAGPKTAKAAFTFWKPLFKDADPGLRLKAVDGVGKWGAENRPWVADLAPLCRDDSTDVRTRAVAVVAACGPDPAGLKALADAMAADADPSVRAAAATALSAVDLSRPEDLPLLRSLLPAAWPEATRTAALGRLAALKADARPASADVTAAMSDPSAEVRTAALAAALAGAVDPADLVPVLKAAVTKRGPSAAADRAFRAAAVAGLGALGGPGVKVVVELVKADLPDELRRVVLAAVGEAGPKARDAAPALLGLARTATWQGPATDALVRVGGPDVAKELIKYTDGSLVRRKTTPEVANAPDVRLWAIDALGRLDPDALDADAKKKVADSLRFSAFNEKDPRCKEQAQQGYAKFAAAGGKK